MESPFFTALHQRIRELGGLHNAHMHIDRYATLDPKYLAAVSHDVLASSHVSLQKKHALLANLHAGPAYDTPDLVRRVNECLDLLEKAGTRRADTMVDVTPDRVGLTALEELSKLKQQRSKTLELNLAAYTPLGFRDDEPQRWEVYREGVARADFIGSLPEADDTDSYPEHIGFEQHCERVLELSKSLEKPVHIHTDQRNEPGEDGTERLVRVMRNFGSLGDRNGEPLVWVVHMVSPSTYDEARFAKLVEGLLEFRIGVICCPSAAIGMRQLRPLQTPTYNSIPRVLELMVAGVPVRLGSDNTADICSPSTTPDLVDEVFVLSAAVRFYGIEVLAHLAAGRDPGDALRSELSEHLRNNDAEIARVTGSTPAS